MKVICVATLAAMAGGCAVDPKALTGASAGATTVLSFYTTSADLKQQIALETIKESAQLEYLSQFTRAPSTCRDNPGYNLPRNYWRARNIKSEAIEAFEQSDKDYQFLLEYSKAFDKIVKSYVDVQTDIDTVVGIFEATGKYAAEAQALSEIAKLVAAAAKAGLEELKYRKLREAATRYQPLLERHAKSIASRLHGLDRATAREINVWRACVQEKFGVIAWISTNGKLPTSAVDLDNAYGAFQNQYRSYVGSAPQAGEMLTQLVEANKEITRAVGLQQMKESIEHYLQIFDSSKSAIGKAGAFLSS